MDLGGTAALATALIGIIASVLALRRDGNHLRQLERIVTLLEKYPSNADARIQLEAMRDDLARLVASRHQARRAFAQQRRNPFVVAIMLYVTSFAVIGAGILLSVNGEVDRIMVRIVIWVGVAMLVAGLITYIGAVIQLRGYRRRGRDDIEGT